MERRDVGPNCGTAHGRGMRTFGPRSLLVKCRNESGIQFMPPSDDALYPPTVCVFFPMLSRVCSPEQDGTHCCNGDRCARRTGLDSVLRSPTKRPPRECCLGCCTTRARFVNCVPCTMTCGRSDRADGSVDRARQRRGRFTRVGAPSANPSSDAHCTPLIQPLPVTSIAGACRRMTHSPKGDGGVLVRYEYRADPRTAPPPLFSLVSIQYSLRCPGRVEHSSREPPTQRIASWSQRLLRTRHSVVSAGARTHVRCRSASALEQFWMELRSYAGR